MSLLRRRYAGLIGAEYDWTGVGGKIRGDYCPACQKMILETKIAK